MPSMYWSAGLRAIDPRNEFHTSGSNGQRNENEHLKRYWLHVLSALSGESGPSARTGLAMTTNNRDTKAMMMARRRLRGFVIAAPNGIQSPPMKASRLWASSTRSEEQ